MASYNYEEYITWIHDAVNPQRTERGLDPISDEDAQKCYEIMKNFQKEWCSKN